MRPLAARWWSGQPRYHRDAVPTQEPVGQTEERAALHDVEMSRLLTSVQPREYPSLEYPVVEMIQPRGNLRAPTRRQIGKPPKAGNGQIFERHAGCFKAIRGAKEWAARDHSYTMTSRGQRPGGAKVE